MACPGAISDEIQGMTVEQALIYIHILHNMEINRDKQLVLFEKWRYIV